MNGIFELPDRYGGLQDEARKVAAEVAPFSAEAGEADSFVPEVRAALAASALPSLVVPAPFGGRFDEVDSLAVTVVREVLAGESGHLDSMFAMQGIGSYALSRAGHPDVQQDWLPRVARLEAVAALALTEPAIGSDLKNLSTQVRQDGSELVVDGHKSFITNAGEADFYCVLGREGKGYSLVLVPTDTPGVSVSRPYQVIAPHVLGDLLLRGARVPGSHRIGAPGEGFTHVLATLATFRASVAGASVGVAQAALEEALSHARGRQLFGTTLDRLGGTPAHLAWAWTEIEMARSLTYRAAAAAARDPLASLQLSSMAKIAATEMAGRVVDRSVQIGGRFGIVRGAKLERLYREARPMRIYEGSTEVILDALARQLTSRGSA